MKALRAAFPIVLISAALTGCAVQKTSWPTCAALGGAGGALIGSVDSAGAAAAGGVAGAGLAGGYCWFYADEDGDGVLNREDQCPGTPSDMKIDGTGCPILPPLLPPPEPILVPVPQVKAEAPAQPQVIRTLQFGLNSAELSAQDRQALDETVKRLQAGANVRLVITGHTDSTGSAAYNQQLSERRAKKVSDYLLKAGISKGSIQRIGGAGETKPIANNATREGRKQNRRVEIEVQP